MMLDYDALRKIYRLEKNSSRLAEVEDDFFDSLKSFFENEKTAYLNSLNELSSSRANGFSNLKKIISEIFSVREKKLLNKALVASRTGSLETEKIASEETETLKQMLLVLNRHQAILDRVFNARPKKPSLNASKVGKTSLKMLQKVPAFMGADMHEYGPFEKGKTVSIPEKIASLLVSRKLAKPV